MEWISVKDRMPEDCTDVLVAIKKTGEDSLVAQRYFMGGKFLYGFYNNTDYSVTHWMPLPEAPKD